MMFTHAASLVASVSFSSYSKTIEFQDKSYIIRSYVTHTDLENLNELCRDVWGGTDYLPSIAKLFEQDPRCDFTVVLDSMSEELVAVGNRRLFDMEGNMVWIEAIRTAKKYQGRGIATMLMKEMICKSIQENRSQIMSCTIESNIAMNQVFSRVGMNCVHKVQFIDFDILRKIPFWSKPSDTDENGNSGMLTCAQNILQALGIENFIASDEIKTAKWINVENEADLQTILHKIQLNGGIGQIPGLGKLLWMSDELRESLSLGLVRTIEKTDSKYGHTHPCLMTLVKDPAIQSLRSKYVCSIVSFCDDDFDSALYEACYGEMLDSNGDKIQAFALAFDGCLQLNGHHKRLSSSLPVSPHPFLIYTKSK